MFKSPVVASHRAFVFGATLCSPTLRQIIPVPNQFCQVDILAFDPKPQQAVPT
jgi:hypothetical protein